MNKNNLSVFRVSRETYSRHPLSAAHFRGKNPFGRCDYWAYGNCSVPTRDEKIIGFAVMRHGKGSYALRRLIVENLPQKERVAVGQALVCAMCDKYPSWKSTTDLDREAPHYHDFYKVNGVVRGTEYDKLAPKELNGIPLHVNDWQSRKKCREFLIANPSWHQKIIDLPLAMFRQIRPGGKKLSESELREKMKDANHAGRVLRLLCPAKQVDYQWKAAQENALAVKPNIQTLHILTASESAALKKSLLAELDAALKTFNRSILEIGRILSDLRMLVSHGEWEELLKSACDSIAISRSSAHNYIKAYEQVHALPAAIVEVCPKAGLNLAKKPDRIAVVKAYKNTPDATPAKIVESASNALPKKSASTSVEPPVRNLFNEFWRKVVVLCSYSGDGEEHVFVQLALDVQKESIATDEDYITAELTSSYLRRAAADFIKYAEGLDKVLAKSPIEFKAQAARHRT